jgi:hypothetical protein
MSSRKIFATRAFLPVAGVGVGCALLLGMAPNLFDDGASPAGARAGVVDAQGMKGFVDPQTGKVLTTPPANANGAALSAAERNAASTSSDGLVEVPSPGSAGGYKVDLKGRFQSPLIGKIDRDGKISMYHPHPFAAVRAE